MKTIKLKVLFITLLASTFLVLGLSIKAFTLYNTPEFVYSFGDYGSNTGQFYVPAGMATNPTDGNIYITDRNNHRIEICSPLGSCTQEISLPDGANGPSYPVDILFNSDGTKMFVSDFINQIILVLNTSSGTVSSTISGPGNNPGEMSGYPMGIALNSDGSKLFVHETGPDPTYENRVHIFNTSDGSFVSSWLTGSVGSGQFVNPGGITLSPDDTKVFVADSNNNYVRVFNQLGNPSSPSQIGTSGAADGQFNQVTGIKVSPDGSSLFVGDSGNSQIHIIKLSDLSQQEQFGTPGYNVEGALSNVGGFTFSLDGAKIFVSDSGNDRITVYNLSPAQDSNNNGGGSNNNNGSGGSSASSNDNITPKPPRTGASIGFGLLFISVVILVLLVYQQVETKHLNKERENNKFH